jgi:hypothetical protein
MSLDNLITPMSSRKKKKAFSDNVSRYFEEMNYDREMNVEITVNFRNNESKREAIKEEVAITETYNSVLPLVFSSLVYRSLPLDEDFKKHNIKYIYENSSSVFKTLFESHVLNLDNGTPFQKLCDDIAVAFNDVQSEEESDDITTPELINNTFNNNDFEVNATTNAISDKVVKAISDEKASALLKEKYLKEEKYYDETKSLFRYIHESNVRNVIDQSDEEMKSDDVNEISMAESILDYTILETLNTCRLVNFDLHKINTVKKFIP